MSQSDHVFEQVRGIADFLDLLDHEILDLLGGNRLRWARIPAPLLSIGANVVSIAFVTTLSCMVGCHGTVASNAANQPFKQRAELIANGDTTGFAVMFELLVNIVPEFLWDDRLMFPLVDFFFVPNLAKVGDVGEQFEQRALVEVSTAALFAFLGNAKFVPPIASFDFFQRGHNPLLHESLTCESRRSGRRRRKDASLYL